MNSIYVKTRFNIGVFCFESNMGIGDSLSSVTTAKCAAQTGQLHRQQGEENVQRSTLSMRRGCAPCAAYPLVELYVRGFQGRVYSTQVISCSEGSTFVFYIIICRALLLCLVESILVVDST